MRLAEKQGLLTGKHLSSAQSLALEMVVLLDHKASGEQLIFDLKSRILAVHPQEFSVLFPEWASQNKNQEEIDKARRPDGSYDIDKIDDSKVEWSVPSKTEDAENERWLAERMANTSGTVGAAELEEKGWM